MDEGAILNQFMENELFKQKESMPKNSYIQEDEDDKRNAAEALNEQRINILKKEVIRPEIELFYEQVDLRILLSR